MALTKFNRTSVTQEDVLNVGLIKVDSKKEQTNLHKTIINEKFTEAYKSNKTDQDSILKFMHKKITTDYGSHDAHVNGFYYIQMVSGTWADTYNTSTGNDQTPDTIDSTFRKSNYLSVYPDELFNKFSSNYGMYATDIDIPQLNIEYESISGKNRSLNYASKINFAGDFSINYIETHNNLIFRYHEAWFKYIEALKKGYINITIPTNTDTSYTIPVPYFNAVWVVIFSPFTTNIRGLVKILGVAPINLPIKQVIGDRSKNEMTVINQNYKSNDMVIKFFETETERNDSELFKEYIKYMRKLPTIKDT